MANNKSLKLHINTLKCNKIYLRIRAHTNQERSCKNMDSGCAYRLHPWAHFTSIGLNVELRLTSTPTFKAISANCISWVESEGGVWSFATYSMVGVNPDR